MCSPFLLTALSKPLIYLVGNNSSRSFSKMLPPVSALYLFHYQDYLGLCIFVGFVDGKIRKYSNRRRGIDISLEDNQNGQSKVIEATFEPQEEKKLLEVKHKGKVTSIQYVPESKEVISSGTDDMILIFSPEGISNYSSGKYKKSFDFMILVQRPVSLYSSSNFGSTQTKTRMAIHSLNKYDII